MTAEGTGVLHSNRLTITLEKLRHGRAVILVQTGTQDTPLWEIHCEIGVGDSWTLQQIDIRIPFRLGG